MAPPETRVAYNYQHFIDNEYFQNISKYSSKPQHPSAVFDRETIKHSGPQGKVVPLTVVDDPSDWKAKDLKPEDYTYQLTQSDLAEIITGTDAILATGVNDEEGIKKLTRDDYLAHWPTFGPKLKGLVNVVTNGRGFLLVRGFPVDHYKSNRPGLVVAFWGLALVLGRVQISQTDEKTNGTVFGSLLNHVTPGRHAKVYQDPAYTSEGAPGPGIDSAHLEFHSDQGATDLIALLSISAAKEGGESLLVSSIAIHNELLRRGRKDLVEVLSAPGGWWTAKQKTQKPAVRAEDGSYPHGFEDTVPFEYHNGYLSVYFQSRKYVKTNGKTLTPLQEEAIWTVAAIANDPDFHLTLKLQPGDIEIIHNPSTMHSRTKVVDGENRHLLRWWVDSDNNKRPPAPHFVPRSNVGPIGGFSVPNYPDLSKQRLPLYPYSRNDGLGQSHVE